MAKMKSHLTLETFEVMDLDDVSGRPFRRYTTVRFHSKEFS